MAILEILEFPDPRLRTQAKSVVSFDASLKTVVSDMLETMYAAPGIGLAAPQVNDHRRIIVIDISDNKLEPMVFINPQIEILDPELNEYDEGCLSVPGYYETVSRPRGVKVEAQDVKGNPFTIEPEGLLAVCIQHEVDHLDGKLFVDYLSPLKRQRIRTKLEKQQRQRR